MPNTAYFGADTPQAHVSGSVVDKDVVIPQAPAGLRADGPRVTFNFTGEWNADNSYVYYDVVKDNSGASWIAKYPVVPKGASLEEGTYWTRWADPNIEVEELYQTVQAYDARITDNANNIEKNKIEFQDFLKQTNSKFNGSIETNITDYINVYPNQSKPEIQSVLNNHKNVRFTPGVYTLDVENYRVLIANSGNNILLDNCTIQINPTDSDTYDIIACRNVDNVSIIGINAKIVGDKGTHTGSDSAQFGCAIDVRDSSNVIIYGINASRCMGDGITVGGNSKNSVGCIISNCEFSNLNRNGISLTRCENVNIHDCFFHDINNDVLDCGIDVEPNNDGDNAKNIFIHDCIFDNCGYSFGIDIYVLNETLIYISNIYCNCRPQIKVNKRDTFPTGNKISISNLTFDKKEKGIKINNISMNLPIFLNDININLQNSKSTDIESSLFVIDSNLINNIFITNVNALNEYGEYYSVISSNNIDNLSFTNSTFINFSLGGNPKNESNLKFDNVNVRNLQSRILQNNPNIMFNNWYITEETQLSDNNNISNIIYNVTTLNAQIKSNRLYKDGQKIDAYPATAGNDVFNLMWSTSLGRWTVL